ncbi:hypothetical protein [uncultured Bacteroides sp.]|nr:hypothetical protein [uncultured Bacteroides sp.]
MNRICLSKKESTRIIQKGIKDFVFYFVRKYKLIHHLLVRQK